MPDMSYLELLREGTLLLTEAGVPDSGTDAFLLLSHAAGMSRADYFMRQWEKPSHEELERYRQLLERRHRREPLQYITGRQEFMGFDFFVDPSVLIPRQDTECLAEAALEQISRLSQPAVRILDLCTGSGCLAISISLLGSRDGRQVFADGTDVSQDALRAAKRNRDALGAESVDFFAGDLFSGLPEGRQYACIVSNPPYIDGAELSGLMPEVRDYEPRLALEAGEGGLYFYRRIAREAGGYLCPGGTVLLEIGCDQGAAVSELLRSAGFCEVTVRQDLAGLDRVVTARWKP